MSGHLRLAALLLFTASSACETFEGADVHAAFMQTEMKGEIGLGPSTGGAALHSIKNDFEDDLGIGGQNGSLLIGGNLQTPIGRFGASAFWFDDEGSGTLSNDFGDIPRGSSVDSEFDFLNVKTYWVFDVIQRDTFRIAPGIAVDFVDTNTKVVSTSGARAFEEVGMFAPVPLLFLDGEVLFGPVTLAAQGGGMRIKLNDGTGTYWDFEGRVGVDLAEDVQVFGGYRYLSMTSLGVATGRDVDVDLTVHGWFLGGEARF